MAAPHDRRHQGTKMAVGHFYSLNLRTQTLQHLAAGEGLHEHDMSPLKQVKPKGLRQAVPKGARVLIVYDKAGIDFDYWDRCQRECAVYFISRVKENMVFEWVADKSWEGSDARNAGVLGDQQLHSRHGCKLWMVRYEDPATGTVYEFLTNEPDLPPGIVAELYRRRWEVEKGFDDLKNKLGQRKAWATGLVAKEVQALMIAITHNLLVCYEQDLEQRHDLRNTAEDQRRGGRMDMVKRACGLIGFPVAPMIVQARRANQRSVKFIRWLRHALRERLAVAAAVARLKALYAAL